MPDKNWTLPGLENFRFEAQPEPKKRLGRQSPLSDAQLINRRDQLVQYLEGAWGEIGYDLQRARTPQGIPRVFARVKAGGHQTLLAPFIQGSKAKPDPAKIRALRQQIGKLAEAARKACDKQQRTTELLRQAQMAVSHGSKENLKIFKQELARCGRQARRARKRYSALRHEFDRLRAELEQVEAAYAQSELLKAIRSRVLKDESARIRRYAYVPLNLADAMAGLPYMGWRQSAFRCYREDMRQVRLRPKERQKERRCRVANGLWYTIFRMLQGVIEPQKSAAKITSDLERSIAGRNKKQERHVQDFLAENWLFLKRAIQAEYKADSYSKSLPFRIHAALQKQIQSQSLEDQVLRERERLKLQRGA
jgi:hypothetical protein